MTFAQFLAMRLLALAWWMDKRGISPAMVKSVIFLIGIFAVGILIGLWIGDTP
jgi:mannose/fructose/N-acetylgalactosamine-specific phosphotransferase system component IID